MTNLVNEKQAAKMLRLSVATLQRDRFENGDHPRFPYIRLGKLVRYDTEVLQRVIDNARVGDAA